MASKLLQGVLLAVPFAQGRVNPRSQPGISIPTAAGAATLPLTAPDATTTPFHPPPRWQPELVKRTEIASIDGYTYLGCWADGSDRILAVTRYFDNGMTPDLCKNKCSIASCPMFGVEDGYNCYCGSSIEAFAVSDTEDGCTQTCWGDKNKYCGGNFRINVYSTDDPNAVPATASGGTIRARTSTRASQTTSGSGSGSGSDADSGSGGDTNNDNNNAGGNGADSSTSSSSSSSSSSNVSLPIGAIVGIAVGAAVLTGIIAALVVLLLRRRRNDNAPGPQQAASQVQYSNAPQAPPSEAGFAAPGYAKMDPMLDGTPIQTAVSPVNNVAYSPPPQTVSPASLSVAQPGTYHEMPSQYHVAQEMPGR